MIPGQHAAARLRKGGLLRGSREANQRRRERERPKRARAHPKRRGASLLLYRVVVAGPAVTRSCCDDRVVVTTPLL